FYEHGPTDRCYCADVRRNNCFNSQVCHSSDDCKNLGTHWNCASTCCDVYGLPPICLADSDTLDAPLKRATSTAETLLAQRAMSTNGKRRADGWGRPADDPRMMVTPLVYAYATGARSSRLIERRCAEDVASRFIIADEGPDHATIARRIQDHEQELADLFDH